MFYSSLTANTDRIAKDFVQKLDGSLDKMSTGADISFRPTKVCDLAEVDYDEYFLNQPKVEDGNEANVAWFYLFLIPSFNIDTINDTFLEHLQETHHDFRIDTAPLSFLLGYSVFGFGDRKAGQLKKRVSVSKPPLSISGWRS